MSKADTLAKLQEKICAIEAAGGGFKEGVSAPLSAGGAAGVLDACACEGAGGGAGNEAGGAGGSSLSLGSSEGSGAEVHSAEEERAFSRIVKLVAHRDRSCCELKHKLELEDFKSQDIDAAIQRACACNLVNDARFADARIRYLVGKGKGTLGIEQELEKHNISLCDIDGWPHDYLDTSTQTEVSRALKLLQRKPSRSKNQLQGNYNKLIREGYSSCVANQAVNLFIKQCV